MNSLVQVCLTKGLKLFMGCLSLAEQMTIWSNWTQIISKDEVNNDDMITEIRIRFVCTIPSVSDQRSLEIKSDKISYRMCDKNGNGCLETGQFILREDI